ncbi:outer membrane protein [Taklimakanibacter lacteus]|uniref:outer membrane protein n=1 Tax=Taklimakanibacter lacteus TaxID=2268456 RepID=UPI000E663E78
MIRKLLWAFTFSAVALTSAQAADVVEPAAYDWSGFYVGAQAGYGWGDTDFHYLPEDSSVGMEFDGFVGGVTLGFNGQRGNLVIGAEADISYSDFSDDILLPSNTGANTPCLEEGCSLDIDWFGTARIRLGYAMDNILPFITGGIAFGDVESTFDIGACACEIDETAFGWTIGGGIEWAFSENWSAKAEYLYVNLGQPDPEGIADNVPQDVIDDVSTDDFDFSVVRLGVNYRFN